MSGIVGSLYNLKYFDEIAKSDSVIHRLHPITKLLTTLCYLITVVSFHKYQITQLLPLFLFPVTVLFLSRVPEMYILNRVLILEPFIIAIGILNPLFDSHHITVFGLIVSSGWITFLSLLLKATFTILAALLFIAATGMENIGYAMRLIKIPKIFVLQLLLTYRYISVLLEEVARILRAYFLRSLNQKGIQRNAWGSLLGHLLLRSFDRAERIYNAMRMRGFDGEYNTGKKIRFRLADVFYIVFWLGFFVTARLINIPQVLGQAVTGVLK